MLESMKSYLDSISGFVWGPMTLALLLGTGLYLMVLLRGLPVRRLVFGFRLLWRGRRSADEGDISPFNALMTALAATVGTGNIAGVATAIAAGGPGAIFWMWVTALVGMATKYAEAVLAVHYREVDEKGLHVGGPMYYIRNGMGARWGWLGAAFALFGTVAAFGIGNTVQANSVAQALNHSFSAPQWITGLVMAALVFLVLVGGIRRLAKVAGTLVPVMAVLYLCAGLVVVILNLDKVPGVLALIVHDAFNGSAAAGGFAGAAVMQAIRWGVARGVFSNEAGLGTAPIAHAAARVTDPVRQGMVAMLGTFIDTIVICTITALVILLSGVWSSGDTATVLSTNAFNAVLPGAGHVVVSVGIAVFAFTTLLGWSYYGERCAEYLFGVKAILPYRLLWVVAIPVGALSNLGLVWVVADILNALMAVPNLIALLALSPVVLRLSREFLARVPA